MERFKGTTFAVVSFAIIGTVEITHDLYSLLSQTCRDG
jgi:hypothetical protein